MSSGLGVSTLAAFNATDVRQIRARNRLANITIGSTAHGSEQITS